MAMTYIPFFRVATASVTSSPSMVSQWADAVPEATMQGAIFRTTFLEKIGAC
jgi:hypothetical protein